MEKEIETMSINDIETSEQFDEWADTEQGMAYLSNHIAYMYCDIDNDTENIMSGGFFDAPYYVYEQFGSDHSVICDYVQGYHVKGEIGDIVTHDEKQYKYTDSVPMGEEIEIQLENGTLCYYYIGPNYLRVLIEITEDNK